MLIILQIIYVTLTIVVLVMFLIRILNLTFRNGQVDFEEFPDNCSSWSIENGCTRVVKKADTCVRIKTIKDSYPIYFYDSYYIDDEDTPIQQIFIQCVNNVGLNSIKYPKTELDPTSNNLYVHLYVQTPFWGFIDDMYIRMVYDFFAKQYYVEA